MQLILKVQFIDLDELIKRWKNWPKERPTGPPVVSYQKKYFKITEYYVHNDCKTENGGRELETGVGDKEVQGNLNKRPNNSRNKNSQ